LHDLRSEANDDEAVTKFAKNWRNAGLDEATVALLEYCVQLTVAPKNCSQNDVNHLRERGWSDVAINDAVQVCSYFNYINRIAEGLGVDDEAWLDALGNSRQAPSD